MCKFVRERKTQHEIAIENQLREQQALLGGRSLQ